MFYLKSSGTVRKWGQIYMFLLTEVITICPSVRCFAANDSAIIVYKCTTFFFTKHLTEGQICYKSYLYPLKFKTASRCNY